MSKTAEDVSASLTESRPGEATLEPVDKIAELLVGDDKSEDDDDKGEATQTQTSTQDADDESNDDEANDDDSKDGEEDTTLEAVADGDPTWESVLGVSEDSLSFDENGNVAGFKTKVNGEEQIVSATDLLAGFQNNKAFTTKSQ